MFGKGFRISVYLLALCFCNVPGFPGDTPLDAARLIGALQAPRNFGFYKISVTGTIVYAGDQNTLAVIDVSNPASPQLIRTLKLSVPVADPFLLRGEDYFIGGSRLVLNGEFGFTVYDISDPRDPQEHGSAGIFQPPLGSSGIGGMYVASDTVLVNFWWPFPPAFEAFDISGSAPISVGLKWLDVPALNCFSLMKSFGTLVLAYQEFASEESGRVTAIDCADPRAVRIVSGVDFPHSGCTSMSISDNKVFLFGQTNRVIDISAPAQPALLNQYNLPSWPADFRPTVIGQRAYVLDGGFRTYNLSDPANPRLAGSIPCNAIIAAFGGNYAFVAAGKDLLVFQLAGLPLPPSLNVQQGTDKQWAIRWPAHALDYTLYESDDSGLTWQIESTSPTQDNGFLSVPMSMSVNTSERFYQLRRTPLP